MYASVCRVGLCSFLRVFESVCQFCILNEIASYFQTVVVDDDSHIERIVLATEKTTVTHSKSSIDLSNANLTRGYNEVRRSMGHIMVTARYSNQRGSKSRQNPCQVPQTQNTGNFSASRRCLGYELQFLLLRVLTVFRSLKYKLQRRLSDVLPNQQSS